MCYLCGEVYKTNKMKRKAIAFIILTQATIILKLE